MEISPCTQSEKKNLISQKEAMKLNDRAVALHQSGDPRGALQLFKKALLKDLQSYIPYFNIGNLLIELGEYDRAEFFLQRALELRPDVVDIYLELSLMYRRKKENHKNIAIYEKILALDPNHSLALHLLAAAKGITPESVPPAYVEALFDSYAPNFEQHVIETLAYQTPQKLHQIYVEYYGEHKKIAHAVDLGCGSGLAGQLFKIHSDSLCGIDLSGKILHLAAKKSIYDELIKINIPDFLAKNSPNKFDLIIAADVFVYFGALDKLAQLIHSNLSDQGAFLFSVELTDKVPQYYLEQSGRFLHNNNYIFSLLKEHHLDVLQFKQESLRTQDNEPVIGGLYLVARTK